LFSVLIEYFWKQEEFVYKVGVTPLSEWYVPIIATIGYFGTIFLLTQIMKNLQPFTLKPFVIFHNFFLTVISLALFVGMGYYVIKVLITYNWDWGILFCDTNKEVVLKGGLYYWVYFFYLSKFYEFIDTFLLCLKKSQLRFLHVYHHWATMALIWNCLYMGTPTQWTAELLNALVHIPMYYYYTMASLGYTVWWKKYLTRLQIIQFIVVNFLHWTSYFYHYVLNRNCASFSDTWGNGIGAFVVNSYLLLFILFYRNTYKQSTRKPTDKKHA